MNKEKFTEWFNTSWWQTKEQIGEVPFNFIIDLTWKFITDNFVPLDAEVKHATCGKCEDCKHWFISPKQEEMLKASNEDFELHETCNNENSFVYDMPTYNYFGCPEFSKLSV